MFLLRWFGGDLYDRYNVFDDDELFPDDTSIRSNFARLLRSVFVLEVEESGVILDEVYARVGHAHRCHFNLIRSKVLRYRSHHSSTRQRRIKISVRHSIVVSSLTSSYVSSGSHPCVEVSDFVDSPVEVSDFVDSSVEAYIDVDVLPVRLNADFENGIPARVTSTFVK